MNWTSNDIENLRKRGMVATSSGLKYNIIESTLLKKVKRNNRHEESDLQINCLETFRLIYPKYRYKLFAIPNGGRRDSREGERMVREGVLKGCLDLFLAIPRYNFGDKYGVNFGGMWIEIKTSTGRLSDYQIQFIKEMQSDYQCCIVRSVEEFLKEVKEYLK